MYWCSGVFCSACIVLIDDYREYCFLGNGFQLLSTCILIYSMRCTKSCFNSKVFMTCWVLSETRSRTTVQTDFGCRLKYKIKKLTFLYVKILEYNIIQNQESVELIDMRCLLLQSQSTLMVEEHEPWSQLSSYMFWSLFDPSKPTIHL